MAWHLNLDLGSHYSRRLSKKSLLYQNDFGVTKGGRQSIIGKLVLHLPELTKQGIISVESNGYYRVHIWFDGSRYYIAKTRDSKQKLFINTRK
jgi:hypothetical protein